MTSKCRSRRPMKKEEEEDPRSRAEEDVPRRGKSQPPEFSRWLYPQLLYPWSRPNHANVLPTDLPCPCFLLPITQPLLCLPTCFPAILTLPREFASLHQQNSVGLLNPANSNSKCLAQKYPSPWPGLCWFTSAAAAARAAEQSSSCLQLLQLPLADVANVRFHRVIHDFSSFQGGNDIQDACLWLKCLLKKCDIQDWR